MSNDRQIDEFEMQHDYDFSGGERGKYAKRFSEGTNIVRLDPDVAEIFPDSESVNRALRALAGIIEDHEKKVGAS